MKALIFAAGKGVRMLPLTADKPKPLLEVLGKPLLAHIMEALPPEITEIILVVGYKSEMIKERFGDEFGGRKITYVEQKEQLGTGDALWVCRSYIGPGERFLVVYADDLHDAEALARAVRNDQRAIFVARVQYPKRFGIVTMDAQRRATGFEEAPKEPKSDFAYTGALLLDADVFEYPPSADPDHKEHIIQTIMIPYMRDHKVFVVEENFWLPVGFPEDLQKAEEALRARTQ
jgi:NDP-sugar pyrophosphorylase family protein